MRPLRCQPYRRQPSALSRAGIACAPQRCRLSYRPWRRLLRLPWAYRRRVEQRYDKPGLSGLLPAAIGFNAGRKGRQFRATPFVVPNSASGWRAHMATPLLCGSRPHIRTCAYGPLCSGGATSAARFVRDGCLACLFHEDGTGFRRATRGVSSRKAKRCRKWSPCRGYRLQRRESG